VHLTTPSVTAVYTAAVIHESPSITGTTSYWEEKNEMPLGKPQIPHRLGWD